MKSIAETRFENARKRLSTTLKNLESVMKEKLHEAALENKMINISLNDFKQHEARLVEQSTIIQNLHREINNLQKNLEDLGKENEFLSNENQVLEENFSNLREQGSNLVESITSDLTHIEEIINGEEEK